MAVCRLRARPAKRWSIDVDEAEAGSLFTDAHEGAIWIRRLEVEAPYRGRGVARALINAVLRRYGSGWPIKLECESQLCDMYRKFGFSLIDENLEFSVMQRPRGPIY